MFTRNEGGLDRTFRIIWTVVDSRRFCNWRNVGNRALRRSAGASADRTDRLVPPVQLVPH